jgi:glycosyltransferase involved in cell wall biosynthesis
MTVTVVVPTAGRSSELRTSLDQMIRAAAAAGPDAEVLVVVNGAGSVPALDRVGSPLLRVVHLERNNVARARNVGIAEARHDTVVFGDDGAGFPPSWCTDFADALRDPRYPVVTAPVRVPVNGPVTAYLNHQRIFDAPPLNLTHARTVTGHLAIRRDRLPVQVRYDETNLPLVGEDVAFGHAVRAAGIPIRWLDGMAPALHLLPERVDEITERLFRYGRGAALVWKGHGVGSARPADIVSAYRSIASGEHHGYRRFAELIAPGIRAAFTVYDHLHDVAFLLGYLAEWGSVEVDGDGLRSVWRDVAARAAALAGDQWRAPEVDYARLDSGTPGDVPLIAELVRSLTRYVSLVPGDTGVADPAEAPDYPRLLAGWRELRAADRTLDADAIDRTGRSAGFGFRDACAVIERSATRRRVGTTSGAT